jgi:hypothetical protein
MTLLVATSSNGQTLDLSGVAVGHVLVRHHGVTIRGPKVGNPRGATLKPDGQWNTAIVCPFPPQTPDGKPVSGLTVRDLTIDGDDRSSLVTLLGSTAAAGPDMTLSSVDLANAHRSTIALLSASQLTASAVNIEGNGGGIQIHHGSTLAHLRAITVTGGRFGLLISDDDSDDLAGTIPGLDVDGMAIDLLCSQSPRHETVLAGSISSTEIVCTQVLADRSPNDLVRVLVPVCSFSPDRTLRDSRTEIGDRLETANAWTRITGIGPSGERLLDPWRATGSMRRTDPEGEATVYRCSYGGVDWYGRRGDASFITLRNGWRTADGAPVATPELGAGVRVDVIRHGLNGSNRDYDTGAVHVTKCALNPRLRHISCTDGGSDLFTTRAPGSIVEGCHVHRGRDYGFTATARHGEQILRRCQVEAVGVGGVYLGGGSSRVEVMASECGWNSTTVGYGVFIDTHPDRDATGSTVMARGRENRLALCNRPDLVKPTPALRPRRVSMRRRRWV